MIDALRVTVPPTWLDELFVVMGVPPAGLGHGYTAVQRKLADMNSVVKPKLN